MKNEIHTFAKAQPFLPFEIEMAGGRVIQIRHPEFVYVPPGKGIHFVITNQDGTSEFLNALLVVAVRPSKRQERRSRSA